MKTLLAIGVATAAISFANVVDISTGVASWQVSGPGVSGSVAATTLSTGETNGSWAPAPAGSNWISWGSVQGTSCVVGQTPGNGCANALFNSSGDTWAYSLTINSAVLAGATAGSLNFIFGADDAVNLFVGNEPAEVWGSPNPLGCSGTPPTSAGGSQATYNNCVGTVNFNASDLTGAGGLILTGYVTNAAINGCPACGDPTGFVLEGDITTSSSAVPEPAALPLIGVAGFALLWIRRRR
ncbi:MAG TPA: PEP-CTERM sorting domain-containing protein [Bryobacteraceae bacterium]|nr:PEP-CTERM sorting domain-containing protein [Bryobacteraceae bacterium]